MEQQTKKTTGETSPKRFSNEDGAKLIHDLLYTPKAWVDFLNNPFVLIILQCAIYDSPLRNRVSAGDLGHSFYEYTVTENNSWLSNDKNNPGGIYSYFAKTVRSLLHNRRFVKYYLGIDLLMTLKPIPDNPLFPDDEEESSAIKALRHVEEFEEIIEAVWDESPILGELLYRYYIKLDGIQDIAYDFLRDNKMTADGYDGETITADVLNAAKNNLQTRKLNMARGVFNQIASERHFPFRLEGKVKKSIMRTLYAQHNLAGNNIK